MTHSFNTSILKSNKGFSACFYMVEIEDFDNEIHTFEVVARNFTEANAKATSMASDYCTDIYNMNIYRI